MAIKVRNRLDIHYIHYSPNYLEEHYIFYHPYNNSWQKYNALIEAESRLHPLNLLLANNQLNNVEHELENEYATLSTLAPTNPITQEIGNAIRDF